MNKTFLCKTNDGRQIEVYKGGYEKGPVILAHHGSPSEAGLWSLWHEVAQEKKFQIISITRPGYAQSERKPGRNVASVVPDVKDVLDSLGIDHFVTIGWSGGGPHALACATLMPDKCLGVASLAGAAPYGKKDFDFLKDMGPENVEEFGAALEGEANYKKWLEKNAISYRTVTESDFIDAFGGLLPDVDKKALVGGYAKSLAASLQYALKDGFDGWIDDGLAFVSDWGFEVNKVKVPVTVWHGELDLMAPIDHGQWLANNIPNAKYNFVKGHGHISLGMDYKNAIIDDLLLHFK